MNLVGLSLIRGLYFTIKRISSNSDDVQRRMTQNKILLTVCNYCRLQLTIIVNRFE